MFDYLRPHVKSMERIARHKWFVPFLKKYMPKKIKKTCCYGWAIDFKTSKYKFSMNTNKCIFYTIFLKCNMPELTKIFCAVNFIYSNLPNTKFSYTTCIGEGGKFCDYSFERIKKS